MRQTVILPVLAALLTIGDSSAQTKKALPVEDFDYSTVISSAEAIFGTRQNIGQGINAMLTRRIAQDGRFAAVERRTVDQIMRAQDFAASSRVKKGTLTLMG